MTTGTAEELLAYDREHLWHPYTSMTAPTPVRLVRSAAGACLDVEGYGEVIDGMSSWWAAIHGYRVPELDAAIARQTRRMSHVMFGGLTHAPAIELAQRLVEITPEGLDKVFLADSGSVSVEVAMKMALQVQMGAGRSDARRFLALHGGYHGDTFQPMSVTDPEGGMHAMWGGLLPHHVFAPRPSAPGDETGFATWSERLRDLADRNRTELAGIIVEPLLQGAGGMWPYDPRCLTVLRDVADDLGLVLIFDEIATGFGRTGHLFVSELATPDILCVGKALTGGYLTLAAVLTTDRIARGIAASEAGVLMHGPTFMGNPLACAVASASIDLVETRGWADDVQRISTGLSSGLGPLRAAAGVADVRVLGAVGVVQLDHPVDVARATEAALEAGVWLRPFRDLIYTMPPYISTDDDLTAITTALVAAAGAV
jgi:adenosylmethionine-8-amino-7-oxononanoate aminotransferase